MFHLKFAQTYDFEIMTKNQLPHVIEDAFVAKENIFCVADGITRERLDHKVFRYPETFEEAVELNQNYPNPSGASLAAQTCVNFFQATIENQTNITKKTILKAVQYINQQMKAINAGRKIDYLQNDYFACVAVGGAIQNDTLFGFGIGDCTIQLLDDNYQTVLDTSEATQAFSRLDYHPPFYKILKYHNEWNWSNEKYRKYYHKHVRNNQMRKLLKKHTYGAITGEKRALSFVHTFSISLKNVKYILAYSDGCESFLDTKEHIISTIQNPEQIQNEKHEKTLLIYEKV